ncbi:MAG: aromatic ring-hydroxylating dioxygenase subunit alpha [Rhodospirillaceae bacterium]|jgi:choline monooxygenase|nr:aromatic ring-hydroxylating dioxygenase subunit alpha [Rhodospirillaceae bacterium]MBT6510585.1 aromatic ring-hydroxylating dioxygenase subunit alpha [Rhodospirillaceae bacterium]MBT7614076.1 aromatic ring-hydroxylating dioxygenase subunit alpha [Rhodospirillaceae bacterium]MBT7648283.1 aromatic ring-hydroxylating dioxygenase subunit alpha [Rhodospirillaceae bacterium]
MTKYVSYGDHANLGVAEPDDMFSPRHYAAVRGGGRQKRALPLWCYTSERFHEAEVEKIFLPSWNLLDREEIVPEIGDFHCMTFKGANLLVVRGKDNKVRVFANTCPHRGALVAQGEGNCKVFQCPYHFWSFGLDGHLIGAPQYTDDDRRDLIDASNREEFGLAEIASGCWGGFIFVRFREGTQTLEQHLGAFVETLASHRLEDMRVARKDVFEMEANWKCFAENYIDGYHIPFVHKDSLSRWKTTEYRRVEPHGRELLAFAVHEGSQLLLPADDYKGFPAMAQIDDDKKGGTYFTTLPPGSMMTMGNDGALVFQSEPISAGRSRLTVTSLFPKSCFERDDFDELAENYYRRNAMVVGEDKVISERQYAGLRSPFARDARLGTSENAVNGFANWIVDQVVGSDDQAQIAAE